MPRRSVMDTHRSRWLAALIGLVAFLLPLSGVGAAEGTPESAAELVPDDSAGGVEVVRYTGSDPYGLSIEVAHALVAAGGGSSEWVVLASGESWTDAAAAGSLAASLGAPVVLVPPGGLQTPTARPDLAEFLRSAGVRRVAIVGDPETLPNHEPSVLFGLGMLPRNIERVHGTDPVGNAIAVAERIGAPAAFGELGPTVIIASDRSVADAVAVGPLAAAGPFPLLPTSSDALDPRIAAYLAEHEIAHVVLVGGTAAIASSVQEAIEAAGITVTRLAGRDRGDTARLAAGLLDRLNADDPTCADSPTRIGLAPAQHSEQALVAGTLLAQQCMPLRYTEPGRLPADLHNTLYLASHRPEGAHVVVFADEARIPDEVLEPSVPPALLAFSCGWSKGHPRHGEFSVVIVDERGDWRYYPRGGPSFLADPAEPFDPEAVGCQVSGGEVFEWSPDGRYLADVRGSQMFVVDVVADEVVEAKIEAPDLRFSEWHRPRWSPDSTKLAFSAFPCEESTFLSEAEDHPYACSFYGTAEMYVFDAVTGETTRLTHNATSDEPLAWSPDSGSIAFTQASVASGLFSVYWYTASLRVHELATGSVTELYDLAQSVFGVWWSPQGEHVALLGTVTEDTPYGPYDRRVFVVKRDATSLTQLTEEGRWGWTIGWENEGQRLLHTNYDPSGRHSSEERVWSAATGTGSMLDFDGLEDGSFYGWSAVPGRVLYWTSDDRQASRALLRVDLDSGETEPLLSTRLEGRSPQILGLSGDERQLAAIIEKDRLVVYSNASPHGSVLVDFGEDVYWGHSDPVRGMWTDSGLRASFEYWRDV